MDERTDEPLFMRFVHTEEELAEDGLSAPWVPIVRPASVVSVPQPPQIFQPVHRGASERPCDCVVSHVCPWRSWQ